MHISNGRPYSYTYFCSSASYAKEEAVLDQNALTLEEAQTGFHQAKTLSLTEVRLLAVCLVIFAGYLHCNELIELKGVCGGGGGGGRGDSKGEMQR